MTLYKWKTFYSHDLIPTFICGLFGITVKISIHTFETVENNIHILIKTFRCFKCCFHVDISYNLNSPIEKKKKKSKHYIKNR